MDGRIAAGDPVGYFDALVEAIADLEAVRDEIDNMLVEPAGPFRHGKGSVGRLRELTERAAAGVALFAQDGRDGRRPAGLRDATAGQQETLPVNHGR